MDTHTHEMAWSHATPTPAPDKTAGRASSRVLMAVEALAFAFAAAAHAGVFGRAYDNYYPYILDRILAVVLFVALVGTFIRPLWARFVTLTGEGFAFGAMIFALFAIVMGATPSSPIDIAFDAVMGIVLFLGLRIAQRMPNGITPR